MFGAFPRGNGDPRLALFGADITPNHHALAEEFAMGDNFYCDAEISITGHEWTDQGNSNDFTEKLLHPASARFARPRHGGRELPVALSVERPA